MGSSASTTTLAMTLFLLINIIFFLPTSTLARTGVGSLKDSSWHSTAGTRRYRGARGQVSKGWSTMSKAAGAEASKAIAGRGN
ncbi:unnamed protein product [Linum trigynum]|uniref:Secreted protein n=1 Tax=Linum trigynum TaxID=586398 RepID=A0AAV2G7Q4_9ROSI